jgi:hypothetical protein
VFPFKKMDDPAVDGAGTIYAPARYDNLILKLDSKTLEESSRWSTECNVAKTRWQASTKRILGACKGEPLFFSLDPATGKTTARIPIGKGIDGLGIDVKRQRIVASNDDGTLTVIQQKGPDDYELLGTVSTRVGARMMYMDERNGNLYVVNADSTTGKPGASGQVSEVFHPDSFVVLTYQPM